MRIRGLWKLPDGRHWLWGKWGLTQVGKAMLNKSLIRFSADGWDCVSSLRFFLRPNYSRGNGGKCDLLQKDLCQHAPAPRTVAVSNVVLDFLPPSGFLRVWGCVLVLFALPAHCMQ